MLTSTSKDLQVLFPSLLINFKPAIIILKAARELIVIQDNLISFTSFKILKNFLIKIAAQVSLSKHHNSALKLIRLHVFPYHQWDLNHIKVAKTRSFLQKSNAIKILNRIIILVIISKLLYLQFWNRMFMEI